MKSDFRILKTKSVWAIFSGLIAGVLIAIVALWSIFAISAQVKTVLIKQILTVSFFLIPLLSAGWITSSLCPKYYLRNTLITGLLLALFFLINNDFKFYGLGHEGWLIVLEIIPITVLGGILASANIKKSKSNSKANS